MKVRSFSVSVAATLLVCVAAPAVLADDTGFASSHDLRRERGRICFSDHWHYGSGTGPTIKAAQADAIKSWASFTALEYGSDWARFSRAASKKMTCSGGSCSLEARPCK
jgi:hypothetical protein